MFTYDVSLKDIKGNKLENEIFYSLLKIKEFRKYIKSQYAKIIYLEIKEVK